MCVLVKQTGVVCAVCLLWVLSSAFCCSFSEICTVGLNGLLHQPSGSAFSNTHSLTSTHKHKNNPFYSRYNNPQRNLKGFPFVFPLNFWDMQILILIHSFDCTLSYTGIEWTEINDNKDLIGAQISSDVCSSFHLYTWLSISLLYFQNRQEILSLILSSQNTLALHPSRIWKAICEELPCYLLKCPDRKWIGP